MEEAINVPWVALKLLALTHTQLCLMFFMACVYMYSMKQESWVFLTCNFTPSSNLCLCTNFLPHHILKISSLSFISLSLPPSHTVSLLLSFSSSISVSHSLTYFLMAAQACVTTVSLLQHTHTHSHLAGHTVIHVHIYTTFFHPHLLHVLEKV